MTKLSESDVEAIARKIAADLRGGAPAAAQPRHAELLPAGAGIFATVDEEGRETGAHLVAADAVGAGPEEMVLIASGSSARQTQLTDKRPVDAVVMAIVDSWSIGGATKYRK